MTNSINRRQVLARAGAIGAMALVGGAASAALREGRDEQERIEGSWYITVEVTSPSPSTFDALYGFADGGVFTRIDGRNNAPALGNWKRTEDGEIVFNAILFNFTPTGRLGSIIGQFRAHLVDGTLIGTFTAEGDGIPGFLPRIGSFTGKRI